ncbi:MAG TPA: universal stress protein [Acidimicrobiales bacterium]|nr:universal stress protein [Acidimicrobiales bacterium]
MTAPMQIVVGYDGSPDSEDALRWAASVAAELGATLCVAHAVGLLEHAHLVPLSAHEERARSVAAHAGVDAAAFEWCVLDGEPASVLCRLAEGADGPVLLVVGTRGAGEHPGAVLGSTSLALAERAPAPVVVVPRGPSAEIRPRRVPDGSPRA